MGIKIAANTVLGAATGASIAAMQRCLAWIMKEHPRHYMSSMKLWEAAKRCRITLKWLFFR